MKLIHHWHELSQIFRCLSDRWRDVTSEKSIQESSGHCIRELLSTYSLVRRLKLKGYDYSITEIGNSETIAKIVSSIERLVIPQLTQLDRVGLLEKRFGLLFICSVLDFVFKQCDETSRVQTLLEIEQIEIFLLMKGNSLKHLIKPQNGHNLCRNRIECYRRSLCISNSLSSLLRTLIEKNHKNGNYPDRLVASDSILDSDASSNWLFLHSWASWERFMMFPHSLLVDIEVARNYIHHKLFDSGVWVTAVFTESLEYPKSSFIDHFQREINWRETIVQACVTNKINIVICQQRIDDDLRRDLINRGISSIAHISIKFIHAISRFIGAVELPLLSTNISYCDPSTIIPRSHVGIIEKLAFVYLQKKKLILKIDSFQADDVKNDRLHKSFSDLYGNYDGDKTFREVLHRKRSMGSVVVECHSAMKFDKTQELMLDVLEQFSQVSPRGNILGDVLTAIETQDPLSAYFKLMRESIVQCMDTSHSPMTEVQREILAAQREEVEVDGEAIIRHVEEERHLVDLFMKATSDASIHASLSIATTILKLLLKVEKIRIK